MEPLLNAPLPPACSLDFQEEDDAKDGDSQESDQEEGEGDARTVFVAPAVGGIIAIATASRSNADA